ncbi:MAG TPA: DegT/DnrJ/EryC1/StrS family aminotransferase [Polyangiaceae bacterium]|nr:DegT/DnrJ/EryC1/StrS family aminotransferase [Polyangiaceae bacterium]
MPSKRIPVFEPELDADDARAAFEAIQATEISGTSPVVRRFERAWEERLGMPRAVAVANGTAALELALLGLGIGPGDEVLCPSMTIISCARAIVASGATPVLVDVDPDTYCLDPEAARARVTERTRAILGVHAFGHPYDAVRIGELARAHGLLVVEDAAQAHGATCRVGDSFRECGTLGDVATFSFYANKAVTTGEGGMVVARSETVAERIRDLANLCLSGPRRFLHEELGHNYRLSGIQAAVGLVQLARLDRTVEKKRALAERYRAALRDVAGVALQKTEPWANPTHWMNAIVLEDSLSHDAESLALALSARGIETRPFFVGLHEQPALRKRGLFHGERYPVTERLARRGLYLPSGTALSEEDVTRVSRALRDALAEAAPASVAVPGAIGALPHGPATGLFGPDFAEAYDALYESKDYVADVDTLERCFARFRRERTRRVLDVGCGTGRHVAELARRGYSVAGVDRSADMLAIARARNPGGDFRQGDLATLELGERFDAVVVLFAVLSYQTTKDGILESLRRVRDHLDVGGLLVADVWFGAGGSSAPTRTRRTGERGAVRWTRTGTLTRDSLAQRVDLAYVLERTEGGATSIATETHSMHYFMPLELELLLERAGFRLVLLSRELDLDHSPRHDDGTALFVAVAA